ncbi:hypothetical protein DPMN_062750 [Dreissena polymorpha]|uniref:Uncharacterized protein n=1 Tax=Dreissena polymorpha TaxID=45954 RepID=A0A9D4CA58_DREPO|nr:hypothetical protein DPMN_062750 [Dreissena polymorpha]
MERSEVPDCSEGKTTQKGTKANGRWGCSSGTNCSSRKENPENKTSRFTASQTLSQVVPDEEEVVSKPPNKKKKTSVEAELLDIQRKLLAEAESSNALNKRNLFLKQISSSLSVLAIKHPWRRTKVRKQPCQQKDTVAVTEGKIVPGEELKYVNSLVSRKTLLQLLKICEVTSFQTSVRSCLCTRLAETKKTVVCHLKPCQQEDTVAVTEGTATSSLGLDLRGDQFPDIGSLLLVYEIGRD